MAAGSITLKTTEAASGGKEVQINDMSVNQFTANPVNACLITINSKCMALYNQLGCKNSDGYNLSFYAK